MAAGCGRNLTRAAGRCSASPCRRRTREARPMPDKGIVHIVDDDEAARNSLSFLLSSAGHPVRLYDSATAFLDELGNIGGGCLITDIRMPGMTGLELIHALKAKSCALPTIVITGHGDVPLAVEAMKAGAVD